jgi:primosomal protein N'
MHKDLTMRFSTARCETFRWQIIAKWQLLFNLSKAADVSTAVAEWNHVPTCYVKEPAWSDDQKAVLDDIHRRLDRTDPLFDAPTTKPIYLGGDPGTGKSEVLVHAAIRAANNGIRVLIMCPTGTLVFAYRDRIPLHPLITIDTLHSAMVIVREADKVDPLTLLIGYGWIPRLALAVAKTSWDQQACRPTSPHGIPHWL